MAVVRFVMAVTQLLQELGLDNEIFNQSLQPNRAE